MQTAVSVALGLNSDWNIFCQSDQSCSHGGSGVLGFFIACFSSHAEYNTQSSPCRQTVWWLQCFKGPTQHSDLPLSFPFVCVTCRQTDVYVCLVCGLHWQAMTESGSDRFTPANIRPWKSGRMLLTCGPTGTLISGSQTNDRPRRKKEKCLK